MAHVLKHRYIIYWHIGVDNGQGVLALTVAAISDIIDMSDASIVGFFN
jgi:hypothetical protein